MLTDEQKQFYADNGYVLVPGLLTSGRSGGVPPGNT